jgi:N-acyl-D-aspartate/D-glutamate deacylase
MALNVAALVGHSAVRHTVMGPAAYEREATGEEIERMAALVAAAMAEGAIGFSTSQSPTHFGGLGEPVPSRFAGREEMVRLAGAVRQGDKATRRQGVRDVRQVRHVRQVRDVGGVGGGVGGQRGGSRAGAGGTPRPRGALRRPALPEAALPAGGYGFIAMTPTSYIKGLTEWDKALMREMAAAAGRPVIWNSHAFRWEAPGIWRESARYMAACAAEGLAVLGQTTCHLNEIEFDLDQTIFLDPMPAWRKLMDLPRGERLAAMGAPAWRRDLQADLDAFGPGGGSGPARRWDQVYLKRAGAAAQEDLVGEDLVGLGRRWGKAPAEVLLDLSRESDLRARFAYRTVAPEEEDEVGALLRDGATVAGSSDAGAHLVSHCNAGFVTVVLKKWVREKGTLTLAEGVHHLTGRPAAILGLADRGLLRPGYKADLVLFDRETIGPTEREMVDDLPGGRWRPIQKARGIGMVIVNGKPILEEGRFTEELPGHVIGRRTKDE